MLLLRFPVSTTAYEISDKSTHETTNKAAYKQSYATTCDVTGTDVAANTGANAIPYDGCATGLLCSRILRYEDVVPPER